MSKRINSILLVDDNEYDNFFHERIIKDNDSSTIVITKESGIEALGFLKETASLKNTFPDLLFLDINMPGMNGWEFLEEYEKVCTEFKNKMIIVILSTSDNPDDIAKAKTMPCISDFKSKPLTKEILQEVVNKYLYNEAAF